ncbi:MAG: hypothetical protein H6818_21830 [Phycisphaerales bacterium]|nr:hypothetical protein [Phycisphaerales bacterium]MCB9862432.1 hypothetical protein [Phycisphaerales bacterium]
MIQRLRKLCMALSAAAILAAAPAFAGPAQDVLKNVPHDAWGFIVVRSVNTIDKNITQLQQMGLPIPPGAQIGPTMQGPPFNFGDNADLERPLVFIMLDMNKFGTDGQGPPDPKRASAILVPAKDPKAILDALSSPDGPKSGIRQIKVAGEDFFATEKGANIVLGKSEKSVKEVSSYSGDGPPRSSARNDVIELTDVYASFSVDRVYGTFGPQFTPILQMVMMQADPTGKAFQRFDKVIKELDAIDIGIRMDDKGIALRGLVQPKKDSDLELFMKDSKNFEKSKLAMIPKEDYLFAFGSVMAYSDHQSKFVDPNPISSLINSLQMPEIDQAAVKAIDEEVAKMNKLAKAQAGSISMLSGGEQGFLGFAAVIDCEKPDAYVDGIRKIYKNVWRVSPMEELKMAKDLLTHTPDAETIEGGKVDTLTLKSKELIEQMEIAPDDVKALKAFFGEDLTVRFGVVGDNHVVLTFGGGKDRYAAVAKLAKSGGDVCLSSDAGIMGTSKSLADPRSMEAFVSVENIIRLVKVASKAIDGEDAIPFDVPKLDAPAGFDIAAADGAMRFDMFVPMKLIDAVKKAVEEQSARDMEAFDEMGDDMGDAHDSGSGDTDDSTDDMDE